MCYTCSTYSCDGTDHDTTPYFIKMKFDKVERCSDHELVFVVGDSCIGTCGLLVYMHVNPVHCHRFSTRIMLTPRNLAYPDIYPFVGYFIDIPIPPTSP